MVAAPKGVKAAHELRARAHEIAKRMEAIQRECGQSKQGFTAEDWRTHSLANEYRALMKEWWNLPGWAVAGVLGGLTGCGDMPLLTSKTQPRAGGDEPWRNQKKRIQALHERGDVVKVDGCTYDFRTGAQKEATKQQRKAA